MKVTIMYRPESDMARPVEVFAHDFKARNPESRLELLNADQRDAIALASLYDVMQYPAIMVTANNGSLLGLWQGSTLPLIDEVASYQGSGS